MTSQVVVGDFLAYRGDKWGPNHALSQVVCVNPGIVTAVLLIDGRGVSMPKHEYTGLWYTRKNVLGGGAYRITEEEALRRLLAN